MKKLVVGNLKMNILFVQERQYYLDLLKKEIKSENFKDIEIVICPPFVHTVFWGCFAPFLNGTDQRRKKCSSGCKRFVKSL